MPVALLNLLNNDEDTSNEDVPPPPPQLPDTVRADLIKIANWLLEKGSDEFLTEYGVMRGAILHKSLKMLRNHQRSVSGGSGHGAGSSPMLVRYPSVLLQLCNYGGF